jgi:hypothetical protein
LDRAEGAEFGIDASPVWTVKKGGFEVGVLHCSLCLAQLCQRREDYVDTSISPLEDHN